MFFTLNNIREQRGDKISNFKLLEPTLKSLHINFDTNLVNNIIKQTPHAAIKLLYELKMVNIQKKSSKNVII